LFDPTLRNDFREGKETGPMSLIPNVFDKYERVARVYPALILTSPAIVAAATTMPTLPSQTITNHAITAAVLLALLYALTHVVRAAGRKIEKSLWDSWGGPPSTRMMLWSNGMMSDQWKENAHAIVASALSLSLHSKKKEAHNLDDAKKLIADAFAHVKTVLDLEKPDGKHQVHNIEYGFARNLLGASFPIGVVVCVLAAVWCAAFLLIEPPSWIPVVGALVCAVLGILFWLAKRYWLPGLVKISADRYAEKAWTTFLEIKGKGKDKGGNSP
jgi:hypothetical protein